MTSDPFDLGAGADAALLLHGFSGTPFEVRPLGEALAARGVRALGPLLPGHGSSTLRLGPGGAREWYEASEAALMTLDREGAERIFVAGFSMGACLAIRLAADHPRLVRKLGLLAPALALSGSSRLFRDLFRFSLPARLVPWVRKGAPNVHDPVLRARVPALLEVPTAAARELAIVARSAREKLGHVNVPTLVAWGAYDAVVPQHAAQRAVEAIAGARLARFANSAHQLLLDAEHEAVAGAFADFFVSSDAREEQEG